MDKRKKYVMVIDTETAPFRESERVCGRNMVTYDIGGVIIDKQGNIYEQFSFVIEEIFFNHELMEKAYYYNKTPKYIREMAEGKRTLAKWLEVKNHILNLMHEYNIKEVWAYNARFDVDTLNATDDYLYGHYQYIPYFADVKCIMRYAECSVLKQKTYRKFCEQNGHLTKNGGVRKSAEVLYKYISGDWDFNEDHTALEDSLIEAEILVKCWNQHKKSKDTVIISR